MNGGKLDALSTPLPQKNKAISTKIKNKRGKYSKTEYHKCKISRKRMVERYSHDLTLSSAAREKYDQGNFITRSSSTSNCDTHI